MLASTLQFDEDNELQLCLSGVALALGAQQVFSYVNLHFMIKVSHEIGLK